MKIQTTKQKHQKRGFRKSISINISVLPAASRVNHRQLQVSTSNSMGQDYIIFQSKTANHIPKTNIKDFHCV